MVKLYFLTRSQNNVPRHSWRARAEGNGDDEDLPKWQLGEDACFEASTNALGIPSRTSQNSRSHEGGKRLVLRSASAGDRVKE